MAQVAERLLCKRETLSTNPSATKKKKKKKTQEKSLNSSVTS
jgi:hypothetical protein